MSTIDRPGQRVLPPLVAGERLDRATFHERYEAMPPGTRAELVGGVVYMPSPLGVEHGETRWRSSSDWLGHYQRFTQGVRSGAQRDDRSWAITASRSRTANSASPRSWAVRPASWTATSSAPRSWSSRSPDRARNFDLGPKKADYERAGVLEYVFVGLDPDEVHWFVRREGRFVEMPPGPDGIYRSEVFPGLWLDPEAFFAEDLDGLIAALEQGLATPEHAAFVARLARAGGAA